MQFTDNGLKIITGFEGCELTAYRDPKGILTIGFGCTHHVTEGLVITRDEAVERLRNDIQEIADLTRSAIIPRQLSDDQFSACVCLAYNIGPANFRLSTLLNSLRLNRLDDAAKEFEKWCKIDGVRTKGLLRRRKAEQALFLGDLAAMDHFISDTNSVSV